MVVAAAPSATTAAKPLVFEQVFSSIGEPATLHYRAVFKARGIDHQLAVWRSGDRLKRVTDQALITYAVRKPGGTDFDLQMLDLHTRISTHIDRTTMYRLGNFTDWFDLTHALRHPKGAYQLVRNAKPITTIVSIAGCDWYTLTQSGRATQLCWSQTERLPLVILAANGTAEWRITMLDHDQPANDVFIVTDKGFVRVDAVRDAERD